MNNGQYIGKLSDKRLKRLKMSLLTKIISIKSKELTVMFNHPFVKFDLITYDYESGLWFEVLEINGLEHKIITKTKVDLKLIPSVILSVLINKEFIKIGSSDPEYMTGGYVDGCLPPL